MTAIRWHEQTLHLEYTGPGGNAERPGIGVDLVFGLLRGLSPVAGRHLAFHAARKPLQRIGRIRPGQALDVELAFVLPPGLPLARFRDDLDRHLQQPVHSWRVHEPDVPLARVSDLDASVPGADEEIEIDFLTLMPLSAAQLPFGAAAFLNAVRKRFTRLFGRDPGLPDTPDGIELLAHLWHPDEVLRFSRSQNPGKRRNDSGVHRPRTIGRRGPLYLRGASSRLQRVLHALQALHLHNHTDLTGWGHFRLHAPARPFFDRHIDNADALHETVASTLRLNDGLALMSAGQPTANDEVAATVLNELKDAHRPARTTEAALIRKADGGARLIERLHPLDLIAQQHLLKMLTRHLDRSLSEAAGAFRPGRSLGQITERVRRAIREGYRWALRADIEDCFPSIDHARLFACLERWLPRADTRLRALLAHCIAMPYELVGVVTPRTQGLAQGSPLSPLLTNLYLDQLDRELLDSSFLILRYADDILVLARGRRDAERALRTLADATAGIGLQLNPDKTAIHPVADGFSFLGERFDDQRLEDPIQSIAAQRKPLVLTQPYLMLGANGETLEARRDGKLLDAWPLRRISEIIILGRSAVSTALLEKCGRHGVPVSMALDGGYQIATIAPDSRRFHAIAARHSQWHAGLSDTVRIAHAAQIAATKIANTLTFMRVRGERADSEARARLQAALAAIPGAQDIARIRGFEGNAARVAFQWLQTQIDEGLRPQFAAARRERGAPDRLNSMLNFGYYLLYTRINALVRSHGLNPYLGLLHDGQDDYETLVADLQEPFRCHVERLVLRLINRRQVRADGFEHSERRGKGVARYWLARPTVKCLAEEFERMMGEVIGGVVLRDALLAQVRALRRYVLGEGPFWLYVWNERPVNNTPANTARPAEGLDDDEDEFSDVPADDEKGGDDEGSS